MSRRTALLLLILGTLTAAALLLAPRGEEPPSILLITLDTTRADHLSCYAEGRARTPRMDRLAASGAQFLEASSAAPLTLPSHATMLTGVFPPDHGVRDNGFYRLIDSVVTVPERLQDAGYRTAAFVSTVILDGKFGLSQGFDLYDDEFEEPLDEETRFPVSRRAEETIRRASGWLEDRRGEDAPFFLWAHFYDPHAPYDPPPPYDRAWPDSPYEGEISYLDFCLKVLLDRARAAAGDDLVILVVGDHGEALGDHREPTHGFFAYEPTIRVPLILAGAGVPAGRRVAEPVRTADVAATILARAGLEVPDGMRGRDLMDVVEGKIGGLPCYAEAFTGLGFGWSGLRSLRVGDLKLIEGSRTTLHDLRADPGETEDVSARHPTELERLTEIMKELESPPTASGADALVDLSEEEARELAGLGYIHAAGGAPAEVPRVADPSKADPRDRIDVYLLALRSRGLASSDETEKALETITRAVSLDPVNPHLRLSRAQILLSGEDPASARDDLVFAGEHLPEDARPLNLLGQLEMVMGQAEAAEAAFRAALERDPNHFLSLARLGGLYLKAGRMQDAVRTYRHALRVRQNPRVMNNLAVALVKGGIDPERGLQLLREAVELSPKDGRLRMSLGDALLNLDRTDEARTVLQEAAKLLPNHPEVKRLLERAGG